MTSEENLGNMKEALSEYSMQFNKYTCASTRLVQMYSSEQEQKRKEAEKQYKEKDFTYNLFTEMVGDWIFRADRNLGNQLEDSASVVSKNSKVS